MAYRLLILLLVSGCVWQPPVSQSISIGACQFGDLSDHIQPAATYRREFNDDWHLSLSLLALQDGDYGFPQLSLTKRIALTKRSAFSFGPSYTLTRNPVGSNLNVHTELSYWRLRFMHHSNGGLGDKNSGINCGMVRIYE